MTDPVEPPDLDAIRERCDAATPGPWDARWAEPNDKPDRLAKVILLSTKHDRQSATSSRFTQSSSSPAMSRFFGNGLTSKDNALFIAHAREDVPALAAALVAARAERDEARRLLEAALLDLVVEEDDDGAYMPGELPDQCRAFLSGTSGGFHTEEPNP